MEIGALTVLALCKGGEAIPFLKAKLQPHHFLEEELPLFEFVHNHVIKYHAVPTITTLTNTFGSLPDTFEPAGYYLDLLNERFVHRTLNIGLAECSDLVGERQYGNAVQLVQKMVGKVIANERRQQIVEFTTEAWPLIKAEYVAKHLQGDMYGVQFGWPYLDTRIGGLVGGDVVSYVGRPAVGKTWKMLYTAHNAWWKQKRNVVVLSMEMIVLPLVQRIAAMHSNVSINHLKMAEMSTWEQTKLEKSMIEVADHSSKLWIVDGNLTSTPSEIYALVAELKPDVLFIDGAYLLRNENPKLDKFARVAENIETIKRLTTLAGIPTICSYQFNREATKKKSESVGLEHIGSADAIGQISSIVLGLFQDETVETIKSRKIYVLKDRDGLTGNFNVKWDFMNMDFSEVPDPADDNSLLTFV